MRDPLPTLSVGPADADAHTCAAEERPPLPQRNTALSGRRELLGVQTPAHSRLCSVTRAFGNYDAIYNRLL